MEYGVIYKRQVIVFIWKSKTDLDFIFPRLRVALVFDLIFFILESLQIDGSNLDDIVIGLISIPFCIRGGFEIENDQVLC